MSNNRERDGRELFAERLRVLRARKKISQRELAKAIGINSNAAIAHWEQGRNLPDWENLNKLAAYFDVSASYLMGISDMEKGVEISEHLLAKALSGQTTEAYRTIVAIEELSLPDELKNRILDMLREHGYLN